VPVQRCVLSLLEGGGDGLALCALTYANNST
jgi:hypothetical protein